MRSETQLRIGIQPTSGIDIDLTAGTPRASTGNLSSDISRGISLKNRAATVVLAFGMLGGAKVALDTQSANGQEPSPAPSFGASFEPTPSVTPDPETGLLPCPTPTPEPSKAPLPSLPPDIGKIPGGEVLFAQGANSNGETVIVTLAQEVPASVAPSAAPEVNPAPSVTPDPRTATNCDPEPSPTPQEVLPYTAEELLSSRLGKISRSQIDSIIKKTTKVLAKYYEDTPAEEIKYWTDDFNKWLKKPDAETLGEEYETQVVLNLINTRVVEAKGGKKAADAVMLLTEAFYRAGFSFLRQNDGNLINRNEYDRQILEISKQDWVKETEDELMHRK